jgi:hypothetical protein
VKLLPLGEQEKSSALMVQMLMVPQALKALKRWPKAATSKLDTFCRNSRHRQLHKATPPWDSSQQEPPPLGSSNCLLRLLHVACNHKVSLLPMLVDLYQTQQMSSRCPRCYLCFYLRQLRLGAGHPQIMLQTQQRYKQRSSSLFRLSQRPVLSPSQRQLTNLYLPMPNNRRHRHRRNQNLFKLRNSNQRHHNKTCNRHGSQSRRDLSRSNKGPICQRPRKK